MCGTGRRFGKFWMASTRMPHRRVLSRTATPSRSSSSTSSCGRKKPRFASRAKAETTCLPKTRCHPTSPLPRRTDGHSQKSAYNRLRREWLPVSEERRERAREILQCALAKKSDERTQFLRDACHAHPRGRASDTAKGPGKNNYPFLDADPSRLAALLGGHISRYYSLLAPCHTGASTPKNGHLFLPGP